MKFPENIVEISLRPDIVIFSEALKQVVMLEPTVPWEERMEEASERKREEYTELVEDCHRQGWRARCLTTESFCKAYSVLGMMGASRRRAVCSASEAAERASQWLWIQRGKQ